MLHPPTSDTWAQKVDPTKLKNRKFATGKAAKAPAERGGGVSAIWTETPEEKRRRLEDEVMGVVAPAAAGGGSKSGGDVRERRAEEEAAETERRVRAFNEKERRGRSLLDEHAGGKGRREREKEDDPTKRAFDREKDVGLGGKVGYKAKGEMVARAKDMGGRFAGGRYL